MLGCRMQPLFSRSLGSIVLLLPLGGCAAFAEGMAQLAAPVPAPVPQYGNRYKVTVVDATIAPTRTDGQPWHVKEPDPLVGVVSKLVSLSSLGPAGGVVTELVLRDPNAGKAVRPSPQLQVRIGGAVFTAPPRRTDLAPVWNYSVMVDVRDHSPDSPASFTIRDADGDGAMGEHSLSLRELLAKPEHRLGGGAVESLHVRVEQAPDVPEPKVYRFRVPVNETIEALAERAGARFAGDWQAVEVLNGDKVRVTATGAVLPSTFSSKTAGPEGIRDGSWSQHNRAEFRDLPHAALVAVHAGASLYIGRGFRGTARNPGRLLLGVNDQDVSNNSGYFDVLVEVNPADLIRQRSAPPGYQPPPSWDQRADPPGGPGTVSTRP